MHFKELFNKFTDFIDDNRLKITKLLLSILGSIALIIVLIISSDEMSVSKEVSNLVNNIESRKYQIAYDYYEDLKESFSQSKMSRLNKSLSKKIDTLISNNGDKYVNGHITKEQFAGLINTVNGLDGININLENIVQEAKRVDEMYLDENIEYDVALTYFSAVSTLNCINDELDKYKQDIKNVYESRKVYEEATKNQQIKKYYEAILGYDKVLKEDEKYYKLAKLSKEECINIMYNYYIQQARDANEKGNYDLAIEYIGYLKQYYPEDESILNLESQYQTNLDLYTMTSDDIINLISKKMNTEKEGLSINSFQQMINGAKFYYVELYKYNTLIDELLVDGKTKKIYSYKSGDKDYNSNYSDGYFKVLSNGEFRFAVSEGECIFQLENKLKDNGKSYKNIEIISFEKAQKHVNNKTILDDFFKKNNNVYYYALVNKGFFKKKELYLIDMYTKNIYIIENNEVVKY